MTGFDALFYAVVIVSGLLAVVRGFAKEVSSILSILAAFFTALWGLEFLEQVTGGALSESAVNFALAAIGLFLFGFLVTALLLGRAIKQFGVSEPGALDRGLGFAFGALRGLILVGLGYAVYSYLLPPARHGDWILNAHTYPLISSTAEAINNLAPEQWEPDAPEPNPERNDAPPEIEQPGDGDGYSRTDRDGLEQLITTETTSDDGND